MDNKRKNYSNLEGLKKKGPSPSNYRLITCLPMMRKILTAQIKEEIPFNVADFSRKNKKHTARGKEKQITNYIYIGTSSKK